MVSCRQNLTEVEALELILCDGSDIEPTQDTGTSISDEEEAGTISLMQSTRRSSEVSTADDSNSNSSSTVSARAAHFSVYTLRTEDEGIKLYILSESQTGYAFNFEVYCNAPRVSNIPFDACNRPLQPLVNLGHTLYVDNYYCCPKLADKLVAENTNIVGTVRSNHLGMP
ncbi:PiggyBac transposable element-derived protein 4 [Plakobranchus ocellatus]|uniref:PiggyBac transposable element-derived protein 4 n=1 Tax=Plakobranchus ocellatus TaxID=259542 RepID=A0AAV3YG04_9GAST|nr:PiggyBac transposable element-derived protein 4 [Plakobranchus ocellatus]